MIATLLTLFFFKFIYHNIKEICIHFLRSHNNKLKGFMNGATTVSLGKYIHNNINEMDRTNFVCKPSMGKLLSIEHWIIIRSHTGAFLFQRA